MDRVREFSLDLRLNRWRQMTELGLAVGSGVIGAVTSGPEGFLGHFLVGILVTKAVEETAFLPRQLMLAGMRNRYPQSEGVCTCSARITFNIAEKLGMEPKMYDVSDKCEESPEDDTGHVLVVAKVFGLIPVILNDQSDSEYPCSKPNRLKVLLGGLWDSNIKNVSRDLSKGSPDTLGCD